MKSKEVYRVINGIIYPKLKSDGFNKTKSGMLGYYTHLKKNYLVIWFQCSQHGFDKYAGSGFIVEIQIGRTNRIGVDSIVRHRIPFFMTDIELERVAETENEIVRTLRKRLKPYFIFGLTEYVRSWYLNKFAKATKGYSNSDDIWFVYYEQSDVEKWIKIIEPIISRIVFDFKNSDY